ncbi:hypothetical protein ACVWXY_002525 [Thermostichus sp. MS-CIW-39]|jgi:hypothetical protein
MTVNQSRQSHATVWKVARRSMTLVNNKLNYTENNV